jgi:hypothetical protein
MPHRLPNPPRVLIVYLPNETEHPLELAQHLIAGVGVLKAEIGIDPLTAAVEVRIPYSPAMLDSVREFLTARGSIFDLSLL